jgi:hypothetical protein
MRIDLTFDFDRFLLAADALNALQGSLAQSASDWAGGLHVFVELEAAIPVDVNEAGSLANAVRTEVEHRGELFAALQRKFGSSRDRVSGTVELRGSDPSIGVIISVDEDILARAGAARFWGNSVTVQVCRSKVAGMDAVRWSRSFFESCSRLLVPTFGYGACLEEYDAKNMVSDDSGTRVVGVDVTKGLPGLYWLNAYGGPYVELLGEEKLMTAPTAVTKRLGGTVLLAIAESGRRWNTAHYRATETAVRDHFGKEFFFSKDAPERDLKTIDFSAYAT